MSGFFWCLIIGVCQADHDSYTKMIRSFRDLIRVYTVCNPVCIFCMHYFAVKPSCSNVRVITAIFFFGVQIFRSFTVVVAVSVCSTCNEPSSFHYIDFKLD